MLWILLLAQVGATAPQMNRDEDGFVYSAAEAKACAYELGVLQSVKSDAAWSAIWRKKFHACVEKSRGQNESIRRWAAEQRKAASDEREEARKQQERLDHEAWIDGEADKVATDPTSRRLVLSALLCDQLSTRQALLAKLAKDKKYAKIGGAVDLGRRSEIQDDLAAADDEIGRLRSVLKADKATPLGCNEKRVEMAIACMSDARPPECPDDAANILVLAARKLSNE
jgi:hypothetical protein